VLRVVNEFPQLQVTWVSTYWGWIPSRMVCFLSRWPPGPAVTSI
jgi:hypothetical protein